MMWFSRKKDLEEQANKAKVLEEFKMKALKESTDQMVKGISAILIEISKGINSNIDSKFQVMSQSFKREDASKQVIDGENTTVFGFYFVRRIFNLTQNSSMLVLTIANSESSAVDKAKDMMAKSGYVPTEWEVGMTNKINVVIVGNRVEDKQVESPKSSDTYITNLMYAKDKFAESPYEKGVITKIINKVKQKYANTDPVRQNA